uniref:Holliday junction resolvase n=1 Tax=Pithovirus LCPAC103 TaxID=2506588 RepID=A0A481Z6P0_9VIRU|nr:MAG: holliday junction resolvase [Pithovirus LCPAC103]
MFQKKIPKSQKPDPNDYTVYNPHTLPLELRETGWGEFVRIVSIDPGTVNYALRVSLRARFKEFYFHPKTEYMENLKFVPNNATPEQVASGMVEMLKFLKVGLPTFLKCHIVIIERQLPVNYKACRFSAATLAFFIDHLADAEYLPIIIEVHAKMKGKMLGASSGLNKTQLKRWSVEKAAELCWSRNDPYLSSFQKAGKRDDIADTITQEEAICSLAGLPLTTIVKGFPGVP